MDNLEKEFETVVREHRSTIYTVCYMFSNDADEVADLFQETLINMWKGFARFRGESDVKTWIWRVALNTCITAERKKKRRGDEIPLSMDINLFEDNDYDTRQIRMLRERIMLLEHGPNNGLFSCTDDNVPEFDRIIVGHSHAYYLRHDGANIIGIWCHADKLVRKVGLYALFSGMIYRKKKA